MKKFRNILFHLDEYIATIMMAIMCLSVTLQIITRFLGSPIAWTSELSRYAFIWSVFIGAIIATRKGTHITIDVFKKLFPKKLNKVLYILSNVLLLAFFGFCIYYGTLLTIQVAPTKMSIMPISMAFIYSALPVCAFFMVIATVANLYKVIFNKGGEIAS